MIAVPDRSLAAVSLFAALPPDARHQIAGRCKWVSAAPGQIIVHHGDTTRDVYFLTTGHARVNIHAASGRVVSYRDIKAGDYFGEFAAIDGRERSASVEAREDCCVARLTSADFIDCLRQHPDVAVALLRNAIGQIRVLTERIFELSTLTIAHRVQSELLRLARAGEINQGWGVIRPAPKQEELASRIGANREAVSREFGTLTKLGVIKREKSRALHCHLEKLVNLAAAGGASGM